MLRPHAQQAAVLRRAADLDPRAVTQFFERMASDYFERFAPADVAAHIRLAAGLSAARPAAVTLRPVAGGRFDLVVVAYDYPAEFAVLTGLVSAFGLNIESGDIYTFSDTGGGGTPAGSRILRPPAPPVTRRGGAAPGGGRKKIVDRFRVRPLAGARFDAAQQAALVGAIEQAIGLLQSGRPEHAIEQVNRRLVEYLARIRAPLAGLLQPVAITFDNRASGAWTVIEIRSKDTPAFLYALSNALALRGIYIHRVLIENTAGNVHDTLYVRDRRGRKIADPDEQQVLRFAVAMIKQFTYYLAAAADPARALRHFDRLLDQFLSAGSGRRALALLERGDTLDLLARLLGASDFLWEDFLRMQFDNLLPVIRGLRRHPLAAGREAHRRALRRFVGRARGFDDATRRLNEYKDREMFRIDLAYLDQPRARLVHFSRALTALAEAVILEAEALCRRRLGARHGPPQTPAGKPVPFAVFGLGKFGGAEMGYASDIELLFVYRGPGATGGREPIAAQEFFEHLVHAIVGAIEAKQAGIFQIDLRLRPHGQAGPVAVAFESFRGYYSAAGAAAPFERQALTKLRWIGGDATLGRAVEAQRDAFVYSGLPWDRAAALHLRRRQMQELVRPGTVNVKYSPGGVVDIEYAVQYLQIQHGQREPRLRTPSTLAALAALEQTGRISRREQAQLREAYLFLRALIDALRIVRGNARDLVLPPRASEDFAFLARRLFGGTEWQAAARRLEQEIRRHMQRSHGFFEARFGPLT